MFASGKIGQVTGPFAAGVDLMADEGAIGIFTPANYRPIIYKMGIQTEKDTLVEINDTQIKIGKTGIYELDDAVKIYKIVFPNGASEDTLVDFIYIG